MSQIVSNVSGAEIITDVVGSQQIEIRPLALKAAVYINTVTAR